VRRPRIDALDGVRAIAAISVLLYHVVALTGHTQHGATGMVLSQLKAGVAMFFVISGFVLYLPYARATAGDESLPSTRAFVRRRIVRILPAYWTALTLWLLASAATGGYASPAGSRLAWLREYGLVQSYAARGLVGGLGPAWSLSVELAFYALLPLLAWGMARRVARRRRAPGGSGARDQLLLIGTLALLSLELRYGFSGSLLGRVDNRDTVLARSLPALFDWFAVGLALAVVAAQWERVPDRFAALHRLARRPGLCWLGAALLFLLAAPIQGGDLLLPLDSLGAHVLLGIACGLLVLPVAAPPDQAPGPLLRGLASRPVVWLGTISYGIFLFNVPVFVEVRHALFHDAADPALVAPAPAGQTALLVVLTLAGAVALGAASWYLVERPAQRRSRSAAPNRHRSDPTKAAPDASPPSLRAPA
jgi:peptidoglycan/LPS O-acetylase OafA/YrhL